jgi:hypothetical protein
MICPNMRAAQIYVHQPAPDVISRIVDDLISEPRVDQVIWRTALTRPGRDGYSVRSSRGRIDFTRAIDGGLPDPFGGTWEWRGEAAAVGMERHDGRIDFEQYPNAFERIAGALDLDQSGELWVTARPGCEFEVPGGQAHIGGASHGALHALDSLSPVILAGAGIHLRLPRHFRSVDLAPLCMDLLGLPMRYHPGTPRGLVLYPIS